MLIIYELNEVPKSIFEYYTTLEPNSAWAHFFRRARKYETIAADIGHLSPWTTWPTVHRGVRDDQHKITDFGLDLHEVNKSFPPIWDLLANLGIGVGVFGSLHSYQTHVSQENFEFFVPDTFAAGSECFPQELEVFQAFNLDMARINSREVSSHMSKMSGLRFLLNAYGLGIKANTATDVLGQLIGEKLNSDLTVRRRSFQAKLAFDIFLKQLQKSKPDISFFFTNHVASSMHRYWPSVFPSDYTRLPYDQEWIKRWKNEIPYTVKQASNHLKHLLKFVQDGHEVMVITSMGQAAVQERIRHEAALVLTAPQRLFEFIGIPSKITFEHRPAMVPQYLFEFEHKITDFLDGSMKLRIGNEFISVELVSPKILKVNLPVNTSASTFASSELDIPIGHIGLEYVKLRDAAGANAYHIPEGMLLYLNRDILNTTNSEEMETISTLDIAPSLLAKFNIKKPDYMCGDLIRF